MKSPAFVAKPEQPVTASSQNPQTTVDETLHLHASEPSLELITKSISAVGAATYCWNIETDEIVWHGDTTQVFNQIDPAEFSNGRSYASLLDPDNFTSRFETVMRNNHNDGGKGVAFSIEYSIKPFGRDQEHSVWLEDSGRWYAGTDGRPREVFGLVRQIDDRHSQDQHLQFIGNCDPLTGMMNRGKLSEALGETIEMAKKQCHTAAFLLVSVSNLATVNDAFGFDVADDVIAEVGRRLREVVRAGDVIGRYSGSKFGIIMSQATKDEIDIATERFLTIARQRVIETSMGPVWAMLSIGAVTLPNAAEDAKFTMAHAEEALTDATRLPTDSMVIYQPSENLVSERKLNSRCAIDIVQSLKENQFTLAYQPVVDAQSKEIMFHEALLRMKSDGGELIAAGHLIPISEKLGLVRLIDQLVVNKVMAALRQFPEAKIAMNISGVTANDPRWFGKLTEIFEENRDITDRLTVEITETVVLEDIEQTIEFIRKLHTLGCKVAIDDFGAGFTSFKNLQVLKVDEVKIDGSFCENLSNNKDNQFFVRTLIDLSKKFDLEIVAEWVENEEDAALLASWGVDYLQGRLYGMAESQSPWGEPVIEHDEVCVVPSEILEDTATVENGESDNQSVPSMAASHPPFDGTIAAQASVQEDPMPVLDAKQDTVEVEQIAQPFQTDVGLEEQMVEIPALEIEAADFVPGTADAERPDPTAQQDAENEELKVTDAYDLLDVEISKLRDAVAMIKSPLVSG